MPEEHKEQQLLGLRLPVSRRAVLRGSAVGLGGLAAAALIGCGGGDDNKKAPSGGTAPAASATADASGVIKIDPTAPYPAQFPEPAGKTPKDGGTLTVAVSWDTSTWDVAKSGAGGTITVPNTAYNRLLGFVSGAKMNPYKLELKPELAQSWERSPDGMTYTFKIQPGVKWHNVAPLNGRDFVAADAAFAFQRYQKEGVWQSYWVDVDKIDAPDPGTLKVTMKKPIADFLNNLAGRYQTIFPKELVDSGDIDKKIVGTGPMIFKDAKPSQEVTFDKNPNYFGGKVHLDGLRYAIMPDIAARLAAFRAGNIDYGYAITAKLSETQAVQKSTPNVQVQMYGGTAGGYGVGMNLQHPKFQDERVRRAIQLAQDHATTIAVMYENYGYSSLDIPWLFLFDKGPDIKKGELGQWVKWQGDPQQAQQLLDAAGAKNFVINAKYYTYGAYDAQRPEVITDQFRKAGITLNAQKVDYTEFNSQWTGDKLEEATTSGWGAPGFDSDNYFYNQVKTGSGGNRWRLSDPQIDQWADQQHVDLNPQTRKETQKKIWDRILDQSFKIVQAGGYTYEVFPGYLRGYRGGGPVGTSSYFYDWGEMVPDIWLDK